MVRLPCARSPEVFIVFHLHPMVALALCVSVHSKLILEAKYYRVVWRGLEHNTSVILIYLAMSLFPFKQPTREKMLLINVTAPFGRLYWCA